MALKNLFLLGALTTALMIPKIGICQLDIPGPRFEHHDVENPDSTRPLASPGVYNYDAQIFSPVEFPLGKELEPNTGFYFSFDRIYTNISGEGEFSGGAGSNYIWGNRYDIGYMNDDDDGWSVVYEQSEGNQFLNGGDILVANPTLLSTQLASVEVNKVFRQSLKSGGWFEPYVGLRYFNVSDSTLEDTIGTLAAGLNNRFKQNVTNDAVGLNVGGRVVKRRGRWRFSNDLSIATTYNQQRFLASDLTTVGGILTVTELGDSDNAFVPAVDYRFELAYNLSRDFGIRGGASVTYLWDGIARANTLPTSINPNSAFGDPTLPRAGIVDDRLITSGFSFGFEYRR